MQETFRLRAEENLAAAQLLFDATHYPIPDVNHKQRELLDRLFEMVHEKYPEIIRQEVRYSPEDKEHLWLYVLAPMNEDREVELMNYSGTLEADILSDSGYCISIIPRLPSVASALGA